MPKVIIWRDGAIETEFDPGHRDWRMGRSETNDITLLDPRKSVSRFHAELREENGRWVFIDLNSQNGSWKDGLRVNRLVLEHGHEVLFGDYRLAFEDAKAAPPPPVPATVDVTADVSRPTAGEPAPPDQTVLTRGKAATSTSAPPVSAPPIPAPPVPAPPVPAAPPVARPPVKATPPRKGINPLVLVVVLIAMLGALAAVAWKVLSDRTVEPTVVQNTATSPETAPDPPSEVPAPPPVTDAPAGTPAPAPNGSIAEPSQPPLPGAATAPVPATLDAPVATTSTPVAAAPAAPPASPAPSPSKATPAPKATSPSKATPGAGTPARPKRSPSPAPPENPATLARYEAGRRALTAGRFTEAERAFQAVLAQQPGFRDAAARLAEAREGLVAARTSALAEAAALEANGEWTAAVAAYERAGASDQAAAARAKMAAAGDDAYRKARQFDARNRPTEAIGWYQRAAAWLPDSDARKATAQERLTALRGGGE
jgi:hypothetical protein